MTSTGAGGAARSFCALRRPFCALAVRHAVRFQLTDTIPNDPGIPRYAYGSLDKLSEDPVCNHFLVFSFPLLIVTTVHIPTRSVQTHFADSLLAAQRVQ